MLIGRRSRAESWFASCAQPADIAKEGLSAGVSCDLAFAGVSRMLPLKLLGPNQLGNNCLVCYVHVMVITMYYISVQVLLGILFWGMSWRMAW